MAVSWLVLLIFLLYPLARVFGNVEGDALHSLRTSLVDPQKVLQSWDPTLVNPCTWFHVTCNDANSVTRVDLGNAGLSGSLVPQLGLLKNLEYLRLNNNNLTGPIPMSLTSISTLQVLDLSNNNLTGEVPSNGSFSIFTPISFSNNPLLCGPRTSRPCPGAPPFSPPPPSIPQPAPPPPGSSEPCPGALPFSPPPPPIPQ